MSRWKQLAKGIAAGVGGLAVLGTIAALAWPLTPAPDLGLLEGPRHTPAPAEPPAPITAGQGFTTIAAVLQSPRCANCHPAGDAPLQTDSGRAHAMNISRQSSDAGLPCSTCHANTNADGLGVVGGPPGAPHWGLPPADTPMVFRGRELGALCRQLRDPEQNGARDLDALVAHVRDDPLVLWGWDPGGERSSPGISHAQFVAEVLRWTEAGAPCPGDPPPEAPPPDAPPE